MRSSKEEETMTNIKFPAERSLRKLPPAYAPSIVFPHGKKYRDQTFCTLSDTSYHVRSVPELRRMRCTASCYGWLILQNIYDPIQCYLFNPVTLTKIDLPPLINITYDMGVLTSSPNDPNCAIVFFSQEKKSYIFCRIHSTRWIERELQTDNKSSTVLVESPFQAAISCLGKIYLFFFRGVAVIDVNDSIASVELLKEKWLDNSIPENTRYNPFYIESCGEIFQVDLLSMGNSRDIFQTLDVFKLELSTMDWVKVENLGDRIFLVGTNSASLSAAEFGLVGNCIYFCRPRYTNLFRFDMDDGTISTTLPNPKSIPHWHAPFWLVPNCNMQVSKYVSKVNIWEKFVSKSSKSKGEVYKEKRSWDDLPIEMLQLILHSLCHCDQIRLRLTCKSFMSINHPLRSNSLLILSNYESQQLPWLMSFPKFNKSVCKFYNPVSNDAYMMDIPELEGAIIRDANYGWLLMSKGYSSLFFLNPLTKEKIELPDLREFYQYVGITFSSPPNSPHCMVFGVAKSHPKFVDMIIYIKEEGIWCEYDHREDCGVPYEFMTSECNPVFCDGVFYCLSKDGKLASFDPGRRDGLSWRVLQVPPILSFSNLHDFTTNTRSFLVEYNGEIFSIFIGFLGKSICIYKLDQSKRKWVKLESLGDKVLFLDPIKSILVPALLKGMENRIYLSRFDGENNIFYHCLGSKSCRRDWTSTCEHSWNCTWIGLPNLQKSAQLICQ